MKPSNSMKLEFESRSVNEGFARTAIAGFVAQLDPTIDELCDIRTAVSEAVTNSIVHAYAGRIGKVYISADIYEAGRIIIKVKDKGCGISDVRQAMEPLYTTGGEDRSGLGFSVMQSVMDKVRVRSKVGGPTTVTLERGIKRRDDSNA
ncbi:MAG: anti-sigma F factor [Oscillospiraceae bacterium]